MLTIVTVFKLVGRSFSHVGGLYGGPTIVPLPVPPYLAAPPELRTRVEARSPRERDGSPSRTRSTHPV